MRLYALLLYFYKVTPYEATWELTAYQVKGLLRELGWIKGLEQGKEASPSVRVPNVKPGQMVNSVDEMNALANSINSGVKIPADDSAEIARIRAYLKEVGKK
jgi:hypothetical protein